MPPTRLADVMLLREQSSWQARPHDKFEGCAQDVGCDGKRARVGTESRRTRLGFAPRAASEGGANELSNRVIAQFLCSSFVSQSGARLE